MEFKRSVVSAAVLGAAVFSGSVLAGVSGNIGVVSDYLYRGAIQANPGAVAVQGGLDYAHDSGAYVGVWSSSLDGGSVEMNYYAGYGGTVGDFSYDVGALFYSYPEFSAGDTLEFHVSGTYRIATLAYYYSDDWFSSDKSASYLNLGLTFPLKESVALDVGLGYSFGDAFKAGDAEYFDYKVALTKAITEAFSASLAIVGTDQDSADGAFYDDPKFILGASYSFDL